MRDGGRLVSVALCAGAALCALALVACSKSDAVVPDAGGEVGAPAGLSCQQIRMCALGDCTNEEACVATCAAKGSPEAKAAFEALRACTAKACASGDVTCACDEQCQADGACLHEADVCLGTTANDDICDMLCA